jgi:Uri superfamily endonuclease
MENAIGPSVEQTTRDLLPTVSGTYALLLHIAQPERLTIGKLGIVTFSAGEFVYVGSAFGSGGLRARVGRHLRGGGRQHWHIDALRAHATIRGVCYTAVTTHLECAWCQTLIVLPDACIPVPGFGSSDCTAGCAAHLAYFPSGINTKRMQLLLMQTTDSHAQVAYSENEARTRVPAIPRTHI